ncbi:MAG: hypothetical protein RL685_6594, partial [Pseudomonadota bacterium]
MITCALLTIGYEGQDEYLGLLREAGVTLLADVRRNPISRKKGFSKSTLAQSCASLGIRYEHLPELGIASEKRKNLSTQAAVDALFAEYERDWLPTQGAALAKLRAWIDAGEQVALTCFECEPGDCHRHCVSEALGVAATHLWGAGCPRFDGALQADRARALSLPIRCRTLETLGSLSLPPAGAHADERRDTDGPRGRCLAEGCGQDRLQNGPAGRAAGFQSARPVALPSHGHRRVDGIAGRADHQEDRGASPTEGSPEMIESLFARVGFSPNDSQRQAIEHLDGPLFLVAGPGSGKTRVLLWRVVNMIVFHGVAPESIFLSTFTEKAAKQLQDGLVSLLGLASEQTGNPYDLSGMYVGTVHALCHRLLLDRSLVVDRERSTAPAVLDELDQYFTLTKGSFWSAAKALLAFEGEPPAFRETVNAHFEPPASASRHKAVVNLQSLFNRLSEEDLDPKAILESAPEEHAPLFRLYELYRDKLGKNRVDLSLLQRAAYRALLANDGTSHRFKHVIVDEYQDTNAIQERIFFRLAGGSKNVCVVGDDDQALYRF